MFFFGNHLTDCYTLIRDFYRWHLDILLPPPEHNYIPTPWLDPNWNRALELLPKYFRQISIDIIKPYDIILHKNPTPNCNPVHMGMVLATPSCLELLHHPYRRSSVLQPISPPDTIHSIWRSKCHISKSD